jgi:hypothetical protein
MKIKYIWLMEISQPNLGLNSYEYNFLLNNITHIIHTAADIRLNIPLDDLRKVNVQGTLNLLKFALDINKNNRLNDSPIYPQLMLQAAKRILYLRIFLQMNMDF